MTERGAAMPEVVCVGDLMVDVVAQLPGPLALGSDTPAPVAFRGGGAAANVASWLAHGGATATFVGRVGEDAAGRDAVADLRAAGVRADVTTDDAVPTGCCVVLVEPGGQRTMVPSAGANARLDVLEPAAVLPDRADALYLSGYALLDPGARPFALGALRLARARGWFLAVDVASAAPLAAVGTAEFAGWLGTGLLLFANDDEAEALSGRRGGAAARALAARFGEAVVKSGSAGAAWSDGTAVRGAPAPDVPVLDTTGAGDAFAAGFLHARLTGTGNPAAWLAAGAERAGQVVQLRGARPPRRAERGQRE